MACPHFVYNNLSKSKGNSIIAKAAYISRSKIYDELEHKNKYAHASNADHVETTMLLPDGAPAPYSNPARIWNDLNKIESDRFGKNMLLALPNELSKEQNIELAKYYLYQNFVSKGYPVQLSVHGKKDANGEYHNLHAHALIADRQLINGKWVEHKSEAIYYKKDTVQYDENGKIANPDTAVILRKEDKVDTPKLKRKKLQYDEHSNIIMTKGWQVLQYTADGKPMLDDSGFPIMVDIREPKYIPGTNEQEYRKNGKYLKPSWLESKITASDFENKGNVARYRKKWEEAQNNAFDKYKITDENGNSFKVDLRSYDEINKSLPKDEQLIPTKHIGYGRKAEYIQMHNEGAKRYNRNVAKLRAVKMRLKAERKALAKTQSALWKAERIQKEEEIRKEAERIRKEEEARKEAERIRKEEEIRKEAERIRKEEEARREAERIRKEEEARREAEHKAHTWKQEEQDRLNAIREEHYNNLVNAAQEWTSIDLHNTQRTKALKIMRNMLFENKDTLFKLYEDAATVSKSYYLLKPINKALSNVKNATTVNLNPNHNSTHTKNNARE